MRSTNGTTTTTTTARYDEDGMDGPTLKEVIAEACKYVDIGCAVLPKHLTVPEPDVDHDHDNKTGENDEGGIVMSDGSSGLAAAGGTYAPPPTSGNNKSTTTTTTTYARFIEKEFNSIVVEHHLKWGPLCHTQPGPIDDSQPSERVGRYDFSHADAIVDWALSKGLKVKGHVLCWHVTTPKWIDDSVSSEQVRELLKRHIFTTVGHYRGRIGVWDVVNEALAPDGSMADHIFSRKLGPEYIEMCFRWAHEADPTAMLLYNDNKVEGIGSPKSDAFYHLLADLKAKEVPIHGCGMQCHLNAAGTGRNRCPTPRRIKAQIRRLGALGLKVNLSEMDVRVSQLPPTVRQLAQRQIYRDVVAAALTEPALDGIWLWGFTDRHTWVTHFYYDDEPLIYDEDYGRKESYYGLREALETLLVGGTVGGHVLLDSDVDEDGRPWGHLWMQPEPEVDETAHGVVDRAGNSKPDWEQKEQDADEEEAEHQVV